MLSSPNPGASIYLSRGFAPRTPLHALSRAASPARSVRVARFAALARTETTLRPPVLAAACRAEAFAVQREGGRSGSALRADCPPALACLSRRSDLGPARRRACPAEAISVRREGGPVPPKRSRSGAKADGRRRSALLTAPRFASPGASQNPFVNFVSFVPLRGKCRRLVQFDSEHRSTGGKLFLHTQEERCRQQTRAMGLNAGRRPARI